MCAKQGGDANPTALHTRKTSFAKRSKRRKKRKKKHEPCTDLAKLKACTLGGEKLIHKKRRLTLGRLTTTSPPPHVRGRREQRRTTPFPNVLYGNSTFLSLLLSLKENDHFPHVNQLVLIEVAPVVCHLAIGVGEKLNLEMSRPGREAHDKDGGAGDF